MICCASKAVLMLAMWPAPGAGDTVAPPQLADRVRAEVATLWQVDSSRVALQWTELPGLTSELIAAPARIVGRGNDGWFIVVLEPVHLSPHAYRFRAGVLNDVPVTAHAIHSGDRLGSEDVVTRREVVWAIPSADELKPVGWEVRRDLPAGADLTANMLVAPRMIAVGDPVVFVWARAGVRIERKARAITPARLGEMVEARAGNAQLTGRATGPDLAQLSEVVR